MHYESTLNNSFKFTVINGNVNINERMTEFKRSGNIKIQYPKYSDIFSISKPEY